MKLTKVFLPLLMLISILACDKKVELGKFNTQVWQLDFNGCDGNRETQLYYLDSIKKNMYGISETQLYKILGRPNKQELGERNRKSYHYYAAPGKQCFMLKSATKTPTLIVDMDALNRVQLMRFSLE